MSRNLLASVFVVLALLLAGFPVATADDDIGTESDTTSAGSGFGPGILPGWEYAKVMSPDGGSWVAVIWGKGSTELNKGAIWVVAGWNRTVGASAVYDENGSLLARSKPITVRAYFMQRFDSIFEFNDTNGDGIANVSKSSKPIAADDMIAREPVYKGVRLRTSWEKTGSSTSVTDGKKVWNLTLTATDLPYVILNDTLANKSAGNSKLDKVSFTFHLYAWKEMANVTVPLYNITVDRSVTPPNVTSKQAGTKQYSANMTKVQGKEDHEFEGWDFDPGNTAPGLLLETHLAWGYWLRPGSPSFINENLVNDLDADGTVVGKLDNGDDFSAAGNQDDVPMENVSPDVIDPVRKIGAERRLRFRDNWQDAGVLTWTSGTKVWDDTNVSNVRDGTVAFQMQGVRRFVWDSPVAGLKLKGVYIIGGFSYAGGPFYKVMHDPQTDMNMGEVGIPDRDNSAPGASIAALPKSVYTTEEEVLLNGSGSRDPDGDALTYEWKEGAEVLGSAPTLTRKFGEGNHTVALVVSDGGARGAANVSFKVVKANKAPVPKIASPGAGKEYTTDDEVRLDATGSSDPDGDPLNYTWKEGEKVLGAGKTLKKKFAEGSHTVNLTADDGRGGTASVTVTFKVKAASKPFLPGFEVALLALALAGSLALARRRRK